MHIQRIKILSILLFFIVIANVNAQQNLAQEAYAIFEQSCLICHGENGSYRESLIIEYKELIEGGTVIPGNPGDSVFYQRLIETNIAKRMPLSQPPLAPEAIETIRQWIAAGAPDWNAAPRPKPYFITTDTILETIENHVNSLSQHDRSFARYFMLTHLYNAGETTEALNAYRRALSKLINSLSWGRNVVKPQPIDAAETVYYIDLRDYEWDIRNEAWTRIEQAYPYQMTFDAPTQTHLQEKLTTLQQNMNCEVPFVQVDWFLATASLPPLYNDILDLPGTDRELETALNVSVIENLQNAPGKRVWRAGFNESGVSRHNRIVERHISQHGAYWKSYDFAGSADSQNIFTHPLDFTHDGGEIIFNLPNGLQAYFLVDGVGNRLDVAPTEIVSDPAANDPAVRNGLSCIGCHTEGMKTFEDEVRAVVEQVENPPFNKERVLNLYVEKTVMDDLLDEDTQRYRIALEAAGGVFGGIEPVKRFHEVFQGPLSASQAAAAVGLETDVFLEKIGKNVSLQNLGLHVLTVGGGNGVVKRDAWTSNFTAVIDALNTSDSIEPRPDPIPGAPVNIPDPNLRAAIEEALGKAPGVPIQVEEMRQLKYIGTAERDIRDLTGLENAISLEGFSAHNNPISDITPLIGLQKLRVLNLNSTRVFDLKPFTKITELRTLRLRENGISNISLLANSTKLEVLELSGNAIVDIFPLEKLTKLKRIILDHNFIQDVSPLAALPALKWATLHDNLISDFSSLDTLLQSASITLYDNPAFIGGGPKIKGPLLWVGVPGELDPWGYTHVSDKKDLLAAVSNDLVTEQEIATNGATEGEVVGNNRWTVGELDGGAVNNINLMLRDSGLNPPQYPAYVVYLSISFYSPHEQDTKIFFGSDMGAKTWLNGALIHKNTGYYGKPDYQTFLPVTLKHGKNVLLVAVDNSEGNNWGVYFGFEKGTEYTLLPPSEIDIPDANLRSTLNRMLDKPTDAPITVAEMESFTAFGIHNIHIQINGSTQIIQETLHDKGITNLTGLEFAINLGELSIAKNQVSDLSPIAGLSKLRVLNIVNNQISDLSPIAELKEIRYLTINHNPISDISAIAGLTQLGHLQMSHISGVSDISVLADLINLQTFHCWGSPIDDMSPLVNLPKLEILDLCGAKLANIPSLENLKSLKKLYLVDCNISDLSSLSSLSSLEHFTKLNLHRNNIISDISPLEVLTNLKWLNLSWNNISVISSLRELTNLEWLSLELNNISDVSHLTGLINLKELDLRNNPITDFSPLAELSQNTNIIAGSVNIPDRNLRGAIANALDKGDAGVISITAEEMATLTHLDARNYDEPRKEDIDNLTGLEFAVNLSFLHIGGNSVSNLSPLSGLKNLNFLDAERNSISDISPLKGLIHLKSLILTGNLISDLSPLTGLTNLETLRVNGNFISDFSSLMELKNLKEVWVSGESMSDLSLLSELINLEGVHAWDTYIEDLSPLAGLTKLRWLDFGRAPISDLAPLANITTLKRLVFYDCEIEVLSTLEGLTELVHIKMPHNTISDLSPLAGLTHLTYLELGHNVISDVSPLAGLTNLETLWLGNNEISDVSSLAELTNLEELNLRNNPVTDFSSLAMLFENTNILFHVPIPRVVFTYSATETDNLLAGDTFTLNLNAENITDLAGWQGDIVFDPNILEAVEVTEGDFLKSEGGETFFQPGTIDNTEGKITSLYSARIAENGVSGTGTLLSVTFKAKAGGETQVTLENFEFSSISGAIIPTVPPNITITVGEYPAWDVNQDGRISIADLVLVARDFGSGEPANLRTDVNRDGEINIQDLIIVASHFGETTDSSANTDAAAPNILVASFSELTPELVQAWIDQAQLENDGSIAFQQGIANLQKLLASLLPEKTALLANYPNPFNPETWIPYHLAKPAKVTLTIYAANGTVVRTLTLGHQAAGIYQSRSRAVHWDGKNAVGESVASGIYFYTLDTGNFTATRKMLILK